MTSSLPFELAKGLEHWRVVQELCNAALDGDPAKPLFRYGRIRSGTLWVAFAHPGGKQEYKMRQEKIEAQMRAHYGANIRRMKAHGAVFSKTVAVYIAPPPGVVVTVRKKEAENAKGDFENRAKSPALYAAFEEIRALILSG